MNFLKGILMRFRKWNNSRRSLVSLRFRKGLPRLVAYEKYEKSIKWILRILTSIGIISSVFTLPFW